METVKHYLQTLDHSRIIDEYLGLYPPSFLNMLECDITAAQARANIRKNIYAYIRRLAEMDITSPEDGESKYFFVHRVIKNGMAYGGVCSCLTTGGEIAKNGTDAADISYTLTFSPQSEVLGYYVSDAPLTQKNLFSLLADIVHKTTFFGFNQEGLEEVESALNESIEIPDGDTQKGTVLKTEEEIDDFFLQNFGVKPDRESPEEKSLREDVWTAVNRYSEYSRRKELEALIKALEEEKNCPEG